MTHRITFLVAATFFLVAPSRVIAQDPFVAAEAAYRDRSFDIALYHLSNLRGLLEIAPIFDEIRGDERERVLFDLARCRFALGDSVGARIVLGELFQNDPGQTKGKLDLPKDSALVTVLSEMKKLRRRHQQNKINATSPLKASIRSLVVPGWGQRYRGRKTRGNVISAAAGALAIGWVLADRSYKSAIDVYRKTSEADLNLPARTGDPDDPNPFEERFSRAESRASRARALGIAFASIWVYGITENFIVQPGRVTLAIPLD